MNTEEELHRLIDEINAHNDVNALYHMI